MNVKTMATSGIIAALYVAVTFLIAPFGFTNIQFRLSEMFNHLVVFNKKYIIGVVLGVFISNLFFSELGPIDLVFGVGHSILALSITILSAKFIKGLYKRMFFNTLVFTFTMFIIAWELNIALEFPFLLTWFFIAVSEFVVMAVGIPVMVALNKRLNFEKLI
ncbi:QueT transporter family protein [Sporosarcina thermotolerans]|uniref:QueT transporter family protein n=1 Tax=Sporosarcina thermotolerans TaxID=633404 RepID=A0AAW9AB26_9BACL|nr:QueT transporter family protein [Sporosarcina thermotolerans]MDW0118239.1 QueT transporter family protein [Sporosarcina thermotolerans]WHT48552.1 QueT transporter family protein [Sporosarcina thermotolerans]